MYASSDCLSSYSGGIVTEPDCKCSSTDKQVNHAVTLVGYAKSTGD